MAEQMTCINSLVLYVLGYDKVRAVWLQLWVSRLESSVRNKICQKFLIFFLWLGDNDGQMCMSK